MVFAAEGDARRPPKTEKSALILSARDMDRKERKTTWPEVIARVSETLMNRWLTEKVLAEVGRPPSVGRPRHQHGGRTRACSGRATMTRASDRRR